MIQNLFIKLFGLQDSKKKETQMAELMTKGQSVIERAGCSRERPGLTSVPILAGMVT